jgi:hypothetical protein
VAKFFANITRNAEATCLSPKGIGTILKRSAIFASLEYCEMTEGMVAVARQKKRATY